MNSRIVLPGVPLLDPTLYAPNEDDLILIKDLTGIKDDEELKQHALEVQTDAYEVYPYPCIRLFDFLRFKIAKYPWYKAILEIGNQRPQAIYLELGCCFGNDARKVIADGFPIQNVIASDLRKEFWHIAHKFYRTTPETFPVKFVAGDVFDPSFISPDTLPLPTSSTTKASCPQINSVTSLIPLQHHISIIHVGSFFHLFNKEQQGRLARLIASLLSPLPGSMIVGSHLGIADTAENKNGGVTLSRMGDTFSHSSTSWRRLWIGDDGIFEEGDVEVTSVIVEMQNKLINEWIVRHWHIWQVVRLHV